MSTFQNFKNVEHIKQNFEGHESECKQPKRDISSLGTTSSAVAATVYALAQLWGSSVFNIAKHAFSGYVMLTPTLLLGVRWRRFTAAGAITSILSGNGVLVLGIAKILPTFGFLPVFWGLLVATGTAIGVSLATKPSDQSLTTQAFGA